MSGEPGFALASFGMPECCTTGRTAWFWKLTHHYVRGDTSKLWRSNAEPLILKLCPYDFDIGQLDSSCLLHTLELAWTLRQNKTCKRFIQSTVSSVVLSNLKSTKSITKEEITFTFTVLRIMAREAGFDTSHLDVQDLFQFCAACYCASDALKSMAVAAWSTCCSAVDIDSLSNDVVSLELLIQTPMDKISSWCKVDEKLISASFRVGCSGILVGCIRHVTQSIKLEVETVQSTWFMMVALSSNPHLITQDHMDMASSIVALYFDKSISLPPSLEPLKLELEGKTLEKLFFSSLEVLKHSTRRVPIDLNSDTWHWIQYRPKVFKAFISYIVAYPSTDIAKLSKTFGRHKMWWDVLLKHLPNSETYFEVAVEYAPTSLDFLWKVSPGSIIEGIPREMIVQYLIDNGLTLSDHSKMRQIFETECLCFAFDPPTEKVLRFLVKNLIELPNQAKEKLKQFYEEISKDTDGHRFRNLASLLSQLGITSGTIRDALTSGSREDQRLNALVDDDLYSALMESIDHDHTNVVGYRSCTAECYCD